MNRLMVLLCCFMSLAACGSCTSKDAPPAEEPVEAPAVIEEINWIAAEDTDGTRLIAKSAAENKIILMFFHNQYCHWCGKMNDETFKNQDVVNIVNENFIPVFVDVEKHPGLSAGFEIDAYPAYWFGKARLGEDGKVDSKNSSKAKAQGYFPSEDYIKLLERVINTI